MSKTITVSLALLGLLSIASCKKESDETLPPAEAKPMVYTTVRTLAGTGRWGFQDGPGATAKFDGPDGVAVDGQGNVYVSDVENRAVRKITPTGVVTTLFTASAPYSMGFSTFDLAVDPQNNVFIATTDARILKLSSAGTVTTVAGSGQFGYQDGPAASAKFNSLDGIAIGPDGALYVSDTHGYTDITTGVTVDEQRIRKISTTGMVSTLAGGPGGYTDGVGSAARFKGPEGLAVDAHGTVYVAENGGSRIRKITADGHVSTPAGTAGLGHKDGPTSTAQFFRPAGIAVDAFGNVFVAEYGNHCIRKITPAGEVSTLAGTRQIGHTDGPLQTAVFDQPTALAIGKDGVLYVSEYHGNVIRTISAE